MERSELRNALRELRRQVPDAYRRQASLRIAQQVIELDVWHRVERVAGFLPFDGEVDPRPLMDRAAIDGRTVYVPMIVAKGRPLKFAPWQRDVPMRKNRFGIEEPDVSPDSWIDADQLDLVLVPLVGFDRAGNRIGVGGGFYDRTFAFLLPNDSELRSSHEASGVERHQPRPTLIGLAFETQRLEAIPSEPWDVPLDYVVSEADVYRREEFA